MELPEKDLENPPPPFIISVALRGGGGGELAKDILGFRKNTWTR